MEFVFSQFRMLIHKYLKGRLGKSLTQTPMFRLQFQITQKAKCQLPDGETIISSQDCHFNLKFQITNFARW